MSNYEKLKADAVRKRKNPQSGDYWNEMLVPVCVVVAVHEWPQRVTIIDKTVPVDSEHWTWDLASMRTITQKAFEQKTAYALCCKWKHSWVRKAALDHHFPKTMTA